MTLDHTICVGTVGSGVWYSSDSGDHWRQARMEVPFEAQPGEIQVRALAAAPSNPSLLFAGSEAGVYRSEDAGAHWAHIDSPVDGAQVWSIGVHPGNPDVVLVGTKPPALYRTRDGGKHWQELPLGASPQCLAGPPKVTTITFDPRDHDTIWVSIEIDGVYRSRDGGDSWEQLPARGDNEINEDVHCLALSLASDPKVLAATPDGIWTSKDEGQTWALHEFPRFFEGRGISYCRGVGLKADDPNTILVANGNMVPGRTGAIQRSTDGGASWKPAQLSEEPNSTMYWFATHPADPDFIVANSLFGYVYISHDAGETWDKVEREFGEVRALAWVPTPEAP